MEKKFIFKGSVLDQLGFEEEGYGVSRKFYGISKRLEAFVGELTKTLVVQHYRCQDEWKQGWYDGETEDQEVLDDIKLLQAQGFIYLPCHNSKKEE